MVRGYKGFNTDMTCRGFQYEIGKTYTIDDQVKPCERGFHFCRNAADVLNYYNRKSCRYAEVEAIGKVDEHGNKSVTDKLHIVRELTRAEVLEAIYMREGLDLEDARFPADEIIQARENGTLGKILPSGTQFPVTFTNGERNILVVCRDEGHTYLVTKYLMAESFAMNKRLTNKGGWPVCEMRGHIQDIYNMLPEDARKLIIPIRIRQIAQNEVVGCEDKAFLLSAANVFGKNTWDHEADCDDTQIDIFREPAARIKKRPGASSASWWWLRSASGGGNFSSVAPDGSYGNIYTFNEGGVVFGFCIETRT